MVQLTCQVRQDLLVVKVELVMDVQLVLIKVEAAEAADLVGLLEICG